MGTRRGPYPYRVSLIIYELRLAVAYCWTLDGARKVAVKKAWAAEADGLHAARYIVEKRVPGGAWMVES